MELNRRDFLTAAAFAAGAAAVGSLAGCATKEAEKSTEQTNGPFVPKSVSKTYDCDIVIVGGGISGLAAAVQAGQNGSKTILIDSHKDLGGNGSGVEGIYAVGSSAQKEQGIKLSGGEIIDHELVFAQYRPNGALWKDLTDASPVNYDWLLEQGVTFSGLINDYGARLFATFHWFEGGKASEGYVPAMSKKVDELGVTVLTETAAVSLIKDPNDVITGLYAQGADKTYVQINAKAVILSTGGFGNNKDYIAALGYNLDHLAQIGYQDGHNGDGIRMAIEVGGKSTLNDACALVGLRIDGLGAQVPANFAAAFGGPVLWVNQSSERFVKENVTAANMMNWAIPQIAQGGKTYVVIDQTILGALYTDPAALAEFRAVLAKCPSKNIYSADTIKGAAEAIGLDPTALEATVARYNELCAAGADEDFNKDSAMLVPIGTAPYYIYRLDPCFQVGIGGIDTDRSFCVLDESGAAIKGLYATGVDGCRLYRSVYPINVPGTACANNVNSGRVAANTAAAYIKG